jgi:hypothetical protein
MLVTFSKKSSLRYFIKDVGVQFDLIKLLVPFVMKVNSRCRIPFHKNLGVTFQFIKIPVSFFLKLYVAFETLSTIYSIYDFILYIQYVFFLLLFFQFGQI